MDPDRGLMWASRRRQRAACPSLTPPGDRKNGDGRRLIKEIIRFITGRKAAAAERRGGLIMEAWRGRQHVLLSRPCRDNAAVTGGSGAKRCPPGPRGPNPHRVSHGRVHAGRAPDADTPTRHFITF